MNKKLFFLVILFVLLKSFSYSDEIQEKNDVKQALEDARRFEIITLGSMPFVTMDISLGYTAYKNIIENNKDIQISPFGAFKYDPENDGKFFESDCGKMIIATACASICVGVIDLTVNLIKRNSIKSRNRRNAEKNIIITDLENDPEATKLSLPENIKKENLK